MPFDHVIRSAGELYEVYDQPGVARTKAIAAFDAHCRAFIARSPFVLDRDARCGRPCDVSPRGGAPGFVSVLDDTRLAIADASGNNRLDSLRNIVESGRIGLLFLIPGLAETLRVNGRACVSRDPVLLAGHEGRGKAPKA